MSRFFTRKLAELKPYTPGEQPRGQASLIKLNTNESPFPPSPAVLRALNADEVSRLRLYSDPACTDFLAALAHTYGVQPSQVFAGNGSDEVLAFSFMAFCERGAAFPDITYGFYPVFASLLGVPYTEVPLRPSFALAPEDYAHRRETLYIANPNAPTGLALSRGQIAGLLAQDRDRLVVVDEAYVDFGAQSAVPLLSEYDNLLVVGTFSKSRSLAGARLGYAVGSAELIAELNAVKFSFNPYNINRLTLLAGTAALQDRAYFDDCRARVAHTRERTAQALRGLGFCVTDSKANFVFAGANPALPGAVWCRELRGRGILVRHFDAPRICDYARITVGTDAQMDALLDATRSLLRGSAQQA